MENVKFIKMSFFQRVLGKTKTNEPVVTECWNYADGEVIIDLTKTPELEIRGGAMRLEGNLLPERVLVVHSEDGNYRAYKNRCTHRGGRRLDPVPGTTTVQCCSVNKSTFNDDGEKIYGPAPRSIKQYPLRVENEYLIISL